MSKVMRGSIRRRFSIVFGLLILLPALVLGLVTHRLVRDSLVTQAKAEHLILLQAVKSNVIDRHVEDMETALQTLARDPKLPDIFEDPSARERVIASWELTRGLFPERSWIYFGSRHNEIVVSPVWQPPDGYDCRERPWYERARYADDIVWINPYTEYITSDLVMSAAVPIYDESNTFRGVLSIDTHLDSFFRLLRRDAGHRSPQIIAVTENGETLMLNRKEGRDFDFAAHPDWRRIADLNNDGQYIEYDDTPYHATFVDVPRLRLKLVSLVPTQALYEQVRPILGAIISVSLAFMGIALTAGLYFSRHFIGNIERLNGYMKAVESGDYRIQYCVSGSDEFSQLNSRLNTMVHHLAEHISSLTLESNTDALCEIHNRRFLMERLAGFIEACTQDSANLAVAMLDVDHFKAVNDSLGHSVGDDVLRRIGQVMQVSYSGAAVVGRYGGEEFMALLPGATEAEAARETEGVRAAIETQSWRERTLVVTVSVGVASYVPGDDADRIIQRADRALYRAKREGRNRVVSG